MTVATHDANSCGSDNAGAAARTRPILHICSDFAKQGIYEQLVAHLGECGVRQHAFVPVRTAAEVARQPADVPESIYFHFAHVLRPVHRILFRTKIRTVYNALCSTIELSQIRMVHSHFLYSDGAVALRLKRSLGLPFITAVRNTDINAFMRYRPDLRPLADRVLDEAEKVVFLSPAYRQVVLDKVRRRRKEAIAQKSLVIPNGLSPFWLDDAAGRGDEARETLRLLYVGDFSRNKNLLNVLRATAKVAASRPAEFTLVGGGGNGEEDVVNAVASGRFPFARCTGRVEDRESLRQIYRDHDIFVMPSITETFGVAYIEALSQGLPVIHSHGQGIAGLIDDTSVARPVNPADPAAIATAILDIADSVDDRRDACVEYARRFEWRKIASRYAEVYDAVSSRTVI